MRVYCGTYHKYNSGSIAGQWLEVDDYEDKDEFLAACNELHKDEADPELMFQDHEYIPAKYISESSIAAELWTDYVPLSEQEREIVAIYFDEIDDYISAEEALEKYRGTYDSVEDYAQEYIEDCYDTKAMGALANYIDYEAFARDCVLGGDISVARKDGKCYIFEG